MTPDHPPDDDAPPGGAVSEDVFNETIERLAAEQAQMRQRFADENDELRDENEHLRAEVNRLVERIAELEARVLPGAEEQAYHDLDRDEKVGMIRSHLVNRAIAAKRAGRQPIAKSTYREVQRDVFDGHPSAGHVYDLMRRAGGGDGYDYIESPKKSNENYVKVDLNNLPDGAEHSLLVSHANNDQAEGGVR